ncbi:hypothetical protein [Shewanella putrefaciens]|uniref:hypothetical protein n=1 Tax=Shewanella putrefaciens TaxID=24 RepID=UPI0018E8AC24|nr:hypothetical protein [Shewanella putrefaciens]
MNNHPMFRAPTPEEINELQAELVAAHAHIELLHKLWGKYCQDKTLGGTFNLTRRIWEVVKDWEDSQCL